MSDADDLVRKADAFISRYRAKDDIPVLTEVVAAGAVPPGGAAGGLDREAMGELEQRLRQQLLDAIATYIVNFLEEPLRVRLEEHLQRALAEIAGRVRADLEALVREAIGRAVEHEISRLRESSQDRR